MNLHLFHTAAPAFANLTMSTELVMGIVLIFGAWMAHRQWYILHAWCQSLIVLLNLIVIAIVMVPSFNTSVRPRIPEKLGQSFYLDPISQDWSLNVLLGNGDGTFRTPIVLQQGVPICCSTETLNSFLAVIDLNGDHKPLKTLIVVTIVMLFVLFNVAERIRFRSSSSPSVGFRV